MTIASASYDHPLHRGTADVPLENIIACTFVPATPWQDFRCWLQPVRRVVLVILADPSLFGLTVPGHLILAGIAPRVNPRSAVTHWNHHGLKFFYPLAVNALQAADETRLQCPPELAMQAVWLFFARKQASRKLQRLTGKPLLPRTLCAVPPTATVEPAATKLVWDAARADNVSAEESYADLYTRLCVSPRDNPTRQLLVDTRLINHLTAYHGFPGTRGEYLDLRPLRGRAISNPFGRGHFPGQIPCSELTQMPAGCSLSDLARAKKRPKAPLIASGLATIQTVLLPFTHQSAGIFFEEARSVLKLNTGFPRIACEQRAGAA